MLNQCNIMVVMVIIGAAWSCVLFIFLFIYFFFFRAETFTRVNRSRIQILDFNLVSQGELTL